MKTGPNGSRLEPKQEPSDDSILNSVGLNVGRVGSDPICPTSKLKSAIVATDYGEDEDSNPKRKR